MKLTDQELFDRIESQMHAGGVERWLILEGLKRGMVRRIAHPEGSNEAWFELLPTPNEDTDHE